MKIVLLTLSGLLLIIFLIIVDGCYLLQQGSYLIRYTLSARDIGKLLDEEQLDSATQARLREVLAIRNFAVDELGLAVNKNYTRFAATGRDHLVDVVTACADDSFTTYTWWFPIVGKVPYKGFYRRDDALKLAERLKLKNMDVIVRPVDAFSTLGFLADPIYDFMLDYSDFELADLIIHEETHATLFVGSRAQFNEELASFVGNEGALRYLEQQGRDIDALSDELSAARRDRESFLALMRNLYGELDALYQQPVPRTEKLARKTEIYEGFRQKMETAYDDYFHGDGYRFLAKSTLNNAYVVTQNIYARDLSLYEAVYNQYDRDMKRFMTAVKEAVKQQKDPKASLRDLLL